MIADIGEASFAPYRKLSVAVRTPHDVKVVQKDLDGPPRAFNRGFYLATFIATGVSMGATMLNVFGTADSPRDIVTFAAAASNLPHLAEIYATNSSFSIH